MSDEEQREAERRERRRASNRASYAKHSAERIAQVTVRRRERKRKDPDYVPCEERVTPPEVLEERRLRRLAKNAAYRERNKAKVTARQLARRKERRASDPEYAEKHRQRVRQYRSENLEKVNARAAQARRRWRLDPGNAALDRERCRRYHKEHRDELLPKQRGRHHEHRDENNAKRRSHYHEHKEENRPVRAKKLRQTREASPFMLSLHGARQRAKKKGVPFDLDHAYLRSIWTGACALSGLPMSVSGTGHGPKFFSPSLDRIDPATGYVRGNVRFILWAVNAMKADATDADVLAVAEAIVRFSKNSKTISGLQP